LAIALCGCALDLATKQWAFTRLGLPGVTGERIELVGDVLTLETSLNEGALFGIGQGQRLLFAALSTVAVLGIVVWLFYLGAAWDWFLTATLGLVTAGILGNLWDRLGLPGLVWPYADRLNEPVYAVRDWIHFKIEGLIDWPVFNLADSMLVVGVGLLMLHTFWTTPTEEGANPNTQKTG
jgi:signal peptidase II